MKVLLSFRMSARAFAFLLVAGALCGCGEDEGSAGHQRLSDFVPIKVVVADIAAIDEDGVTALYRVSGSAFLKVPVGSIVQEPGKAENGVVLKKVPIPSVEERSIRFDSVEQLDADRSCFTTVNAAAKVHQRLFAGVHDSIRKTAEDPEILHEAQVATRQILDGFYAVQGRILEGIEWTSGTGDAK
ncbi:MAG: hypothetical protein E7049_02560 [Lentisphaerae bacterium]|jgi:hypothetical protein|nr:hypothetical protein [Lentisphaerota bacterium]